MSRHVYHHPTAIIAKNAELDPDVTVGPYTIIEPDTKIGSRTIIGSHNCIKAGTTLGTDNVTTEGVVIGGAPQDTRFDPKQKSFVTIGHHNTFREHVTIHRSAHPGKTTTLGDHNLLMCQTHIAHDVTLGSHVVMANIALLAGHVEVADGAFISGNVVIHQHARIGKNAMLSGLIRVSADAPPFSLIAGFRACFVGVNAIGMRRAQIPPHERIAIKNFYNDFYLAADRSVFLKTFSNPSPFIAEIITFIQQSKRGILKNRNETLASAHLAVQTHPDDFLL